MKRLNCKFIRINSALLMLTPTICLSSCVKHEDKKEYSFSIEARQYLVDESCVEFEIHCSDLLNDTLSNIVLFQKGVVFDAIESCEMVDGVAQIHFTKVNLPQLPFSADDISLSFLIETMDTQFTISNISIYAPVNPVDVEFELIEHSYFDDWISDDKPAMYSSEPLYLHAGEEYTFVFTSLLLSNPDYETTPTLLIYTDDGHDFAMTNDFYSEPLLSIEGGSKQYKGQFTTGNVYAFWKAFSEGWSVNNDLYNKKITITLKLKRSFDAARIEFLYKDK